jgi:hypothetical protein
VLKFPAGGDPQICPTLDANFNEFGHNRSASGNKR